MWIGRELSKLSKYSCLLIPASLTTFTTMRMISLSDAGAVARLHVAGRCAFKKRDDFVPPGRFCLLLYIILYPDWSTIHPFSYVICLNVRKNGKNHKTDAVFSFLVGKREEQTGWWCSTGVLPHSYRRRADNLQSKISKKLDNLDFPALVLTRRTFSPELIIPPDYEEIGRILGRFSEIDFPSILIALFWETSS